MTANRSVLQRIVNWAWHATHADTKPRPRRRGYQAAKSSRLLGMTLGTDESANAALRAALPQLRQRARELEQNNVYGARFLNALDVNVIGPDGIRLQMNVRDERGKPDKIANQKIEAAWGEWSAKGVCTVCGRYAFEDVQSLILRGMARDGEALIRKVFGTAAQNKFGFALQILEADHLDINKRGDNGDTFIEMGVEANRWERPVRYHLLKHHPGDLIRSQDWEILPADRVYHVFKAGRAQQWRGIPWVAPALIRLKHLDAYEEAELVAARAAASKMGFFINEEGEEYLPDDDEEHRDPSGALLSDFEAGTFEELPPGYKFEPFDPQHPTTAFKDFIASMLQGTGSGLGLPYHVLSGDLSKGNFGSIRAGEISARDEWRGVQRLVMRNALSPINSDWLLWSLTMGALDLPLDEYDRFNAAGWRPRGWQWIDPLKDAQANVLLINNRLKSRRSCAAELGLEWDEEVEQIASEHNELDRLGLAIAVEGATANDPTDGEDQNEDGDDGDGDGGDGGEDQNEDGDELHDGEKPALKELFDAYGVGVRAGVITPQQDDERHFRTVANLPKQSSAATEAWEKDGGVRRPITLAESSGGRSGVSGDGDNDETSED